MIRAFLVFFAAVVFQTSCVEMPKTDFVVPASDDTVANSDQTVKPELSERESYAIYTSLTELIYCHDENLPPLFGARIYQGLIYRRKTGIPPKGFVESVRIEVGDALADSFEQNNRQSARLAPEYLTPFLISGFDVDLDPKAMLLKWNRGKSPRAEASVVFSNLGFDPRTNECLVYCEFCSEGSKLVRFWYKIKLGLIRPNDSFTGRYNGIESGELILAK